MSTHPSPAMLSRLGAGDEIPNGQALALESHILVCEPCRALVVAEATAPDLDTIWATIQVNLEYRRQPRVERLITRAGVPDSMARIIVATPTLRSQWAIGMLVVLAFAALTARFASSGMFFLAVAPVIPVLGVALSFGARSDPCYEECLAAPIDSLRLILLRTVAVLVPSVVLEVAFSFLLPRSDWGVGWLLPALALTLLTLALSEVIPVVVAAAASLVGWGLLLAIVEVAPSIPLDPFNRTGQLLMLCLGIASAACLVLGKERLEVWR